MPTYECTVEVKYGFEEDDGMPRSISFDESDPDAKPKVYIYGQVDLVLTSGQYTFKLSPWDVGDSIEAMFINLAGDLLKCCQGVQEIRTDDRDFTNRDFTLRREGVRLILKQEKWFDGTRQEWEAADWRIFRLDVREFARELFEAATRYEAEVSTAIGKWGPEVMKPFREHMEEISASLLVALQSTGRER